jgi:uncharacterized Tic20 family protein
MSNPPPPAGPSYNPYIDPAAGPMPMSVAEEKQWSILDYILSLFFGWVAALIFFLLAKDRGPFVRHHVANEWNFQLTQIIVTFVVGIVAFGGLIVSIAATRGSTDGAPPALGLFFLGYVLIIAIRVIGIVFGIIAAVKASRGELYTYPIAFRFVKL